MSDTMFVDRAAISELREQILANSVVLFPTVTDKFTAANRFLNHGHVPNTDAFKIITVQAIAPHEHEGAPRSGFKAIIVYNVYPRGTIRRSLYQVLML